MAQHERVLRLISAIRASRADAVRVYTEGGCYQFFLILAAVFPAARAWYDSDHVITGIGTRFYDITGEVAKGRHLPMEVEPRWLEEAPHWRSTAC